MNNENNILVSPLRQMSVKELAALIYSKENTEEQAECYYTTILTDKIWFVQEKKNIIVDNSIPEHYYLVACPHCNVYMQILPTEIACRIFRHGSYKLSGKQLSPHLSKKECDKLFQSEQIYGCSKPFTFNGKDVNKCEYL
jgi:hypothetical protein